MAFSDNFAAMDIDHLTAFPDSWISETYARDTEALTKALQISLLKTTGFSPLDADYFNPYVLDAANNYPDVVSSTPSNLSGSDADSPFSRRTGVAAGKVTKRKSRASKRSQTTFIAADPSNFRQMVQEVTGVKLSGTRAGGSAAPPFRPEPQKLTASVHSLPTLDTSALLLDRYQNVRSAMPTAPEIIPEPLTARTESASSFNFESFSCFPTLESFHS